LENHENIFQKNLLGFFKGMGETIFAVAFCDHERPIGQAFLYPVVLRGYLSISCGNPEHQSVR
jgi:hypothetical protein